MSELIASHPFRPVKNHPDDDECTATDPIDGLYCGAVESDHEWSER